MGGGTPASGNVGTDGAGARVGERAPMGGGTPASGMHVPVGVVGLMSASVEVLDRRFGLGALPGYVGLGRGQSVRVWRGWGSTVEGLKRRRGGGDATEMRWRAGLLGRAGVA